MELLPFFASYKRSRDRQHRWLVRLLQGFSLLPVGLLGYFYPRPLKLYPSKTGEAGARKSRREAIREMTGQYTFDPLRSSFHWGRQLDSSSDKDDTKLLRGPTWELSLGCHEGTKTSPGRARQVPLPCTRKTVVENSGVEPAAVTVSGRCHRVAARICPSTTIGAKSQPTATGLRGIRTQPSPSYSPWRCLPSNIFIAAARTT